MFNFNPESSHAWLDAVDRHRRGHAGALAAMIRSGRPVPDSLREYIADVVGRSRGPRGRPAKELTGKDIYKGRAIYGRFHQLRRAILHPDGLRVAATYADALTKVAREFGTSETEVAHIIRKPMDDGPEK